MTNALRKTLVISPAPSHPQNAGNRARIHNFLSSIKEKECEIHFCYFDMEGSSIHVKSGADKAGMSKTWDKFIYIPFIPPGQLKLCSKYILQVSSIVSAKDKAISSILKRKFYFVFNFLPILSGFKYLFLNSIFFFTNIVIKTLAYLRKKNHWSYYFMRSTYRLIKNGYKKRDGSAKLDLENLFLSGFAKNEISEHNTCDLNDNSNFAIDSWYSEGVDHIIKELHKKHQYSSVIVEYVFMSKALLNFDGSVLKIIDTHDLFTDRHLKYTNAGISDTFFSTTQKEESKGLDRADLILAIQDKERIQFESMTKKQIITLGHKIKLEKPVPRIKQTNHILYTGSGNTSNIQGIQNFITNIFPKVQSSIPSATLIIAGNICNHLTKAHGCRLLGEITNIYSAYAQADIVINPAVLGTGLKIKNIEALGFSKPMVTTRHSAEGIATDPNAFFIAENDEEFSYYIIKLLNDYNLYNEMSKNAFIVAQNYNSVIDNKLNQIMATTTHIKK